MSRTGNVPWRRLALLLLLGPACATRVGNPPKPGTIVVPLIDQIIPSTVAPSGTADGEFAGSDDFLATLASSSPRHRETIAGVNAIGEMINGMELVLDEAKTVMVGDLEVRAIVRSDAAEIGLRHAVLCSGGKAFYTASWLDSSADLDGAADLIADPLGAFATVAEKDRQFLAAWTFAVTEEQKEIQITLDGTPAENDPFVGDLARVLDRSRFRKSAAAEGVAFQELQLWYAEGVPDDLTPQITVAGLLAADGGYDYAVHHAEATLFCDQPLDRTKPSKPGWCFAYEAPAGGKQAAFRDAAAAQLVWGRLGDEGLMDPQTTVVPSVMGECPQ